jgi:hypothetical protein
MSADRKKVLARREAKAKRRGPRPSSQLPSNPIRKRSPDVGTTVVVIPRQTYLIRNHIDTEGFAEWIDDPTQLDEGETFWKSVEANTAAEAASMCGPTAIAWRELVLVEVMETGENAGKERKVTVFGVAPTNTDPQADRQPVLVLETIFTSGRDFHRHLFPEGTCEGAAKNWEFDVVEEQVFHFRRKW